MPTDYHHGVRVVEINEGERGIRVADIVIGIVGTAPDAHPQAAASLLSGAVADNNALTWSAANPGSGGNNIRIHLKDPQAASQALAVAVVTVEEVPTITVSLATDATGAVTSTATQVAAAIGADADAAALLSVADTDTSDGSGVVAASIKPQNLSGGQDDAYPLDTPSLILTQAKVAQLGGTGSLPSAVAAIRQLTRTPIVAVRVAEGVDRPATIANILGNGTSTGLYALLASNSKLGLVPRILGIPEYDSAEVTNALLSVAEKTRGFVYAYCDGATTPTEAIQYRAKFGSRRLMLIWPKFTGWNTATSSIENLNPISRGLGLRAKIDEDVGWHKTLSNVVLDGPTGISYPVTWALQDPDTEADYLNAAEVTTLIQRDGFRFWGDRTCDIDGLFPFENYTRTSDMIAEAIAESHMWAIDKPMQRSLVRDILEGINSKLREWTRLGYILGGSAWIDPELNTAAVLKDGKLYIDYDYTPVPPLENLVFQQHITDRYLINLAASLAA